MSSGGFSWTVMWSIFRSDRSLIWNVVVWCMFPRFGIKCYRDSSCKNELSVISYSPSCHMICFILWKAKKGCFEKCLKNSFCPTNESPKQYWRNTENTGTFFNICILQKQKVLHAWSDINMSKLFFIFGLTFSCWGSI